MPTYGEVADGARNTVMETMFEGDIRGAHGWETKGVLHHLYRAANHIMLYLIGDRSEDHVSHAITRLSMVRYLKPLLLTRATTVNSAVLHCDRSKFFAKLVRKIEAYGLC